MSWQVYVDQNLVGTGQVARAAILGQQGGIWARSAGFSLSADEQKAILTVHSNLDYTRVRGITLNGKKYDTVQIDKSSFLGKAGDNGCIIIRTKQAIIVALSIVPVHLVQAQAVVQDLADYLVSQGY
ncbi:profilin [Phanerochaete sordida]|uniref:Profilin n=1 Tax=Phanerochaete sordida TaxID=48140 RepID=A0A9P3GMP9_9APHY|nr:profilin [Phanerochaete sordida]